MQDLARIHDELANPSPATSEAGLEQLLRL